MKIILGLSLLLNVILVSVLLGRSPEVIPEEEDSSLSDSSLETKTFPRPVAEVMRENKETFPKKAPASPGEVVTDFSMELDTYELSVSADKAEQDALEFVTVQLQLPEDIYQKHQKMRQNFYDKMAKSWGNPPKEPSIKQKRLLLDIEEEYVNELQKLYGKKNWEKLEEFRHKYNQEGFKRQSVEKVPFIFMSQ